MAITKTDIINKAIRALAEASVAASINESVAAREAESAYEMCRLSLLESHPWDFALKQVVSTKETSTPLFGYTYQHAKPTDFVRWVEEEENLPFKPVGEKIHADSDELELLYVYDVSDVAKFSPSFSEALGYKIAADIALVVTDKESVRNDMIRMYLATTRRAKFNNSALWRRGLCL
jgi:hypothetical protein